MKITVIKMGGFYASKIRITIRTVCAGPDIKLDEISIDHKATLSLGETELCCTVTRATRNKNGSYNFLLAVPDSSASCSLIHSYHGKSNLDIPLLLEGTVDPELASEVAALLDELSEKEHCSKDELLCELTQFKNVMGKRDLNLVSAKQMPVLKDKILRRLEPEPEEGSVLL